MLHAKTIIARFRLLLACLLMMTTACDRDGQEASKSETPQTSRESKTAIVPGAFNGPFHASVKGSVSVLTLQQDGTKLSGKLENASLTGEITDNIAKGSLKDPNDGKIMPIQFTLTLNGDKLSMRLQATHPETGETVQIPEVVYTRGIAPKIDPQHDPDLVGAWRYTWAAGSDGASAAVDEWLYINADGTCHEGDSRAAGGNADAGIETSGGERPFSGEWRSSDQWLHLREENGNDWIPLARYYVEGNKLLFTYPDDSKKIWYRQ